MKEYIEREAQREAQRESEKGAQAFKELCIIAAIARIEAAK